MSEQLPEKLPMGLDIELDREEDGRYIAEIPSLPGVLVYGATEKEAVIRAKTLASEILASKATKPVLS